jgi:peptidoglycan/xylan/chitin deacetylase (PgdA/CDA1 family)
LPQPRKTGTWMFLSKFVIVMPLVRRPDKARRCADRGPRYRRPPTLALMVISLVLLTLGASPFSCSDRSHSQRAQQANSSKRSESSLVHKGRLSATNPDTSSDDAWSTVTAQDASPSLATPNDTIQFGHQVALTFDDGPDPTTSAILGVLRRYHVKATFFVVGARAQQHPELVKRIASEGHTLGNHTYYHRDMTSLTPEQMSQELRDTQTAIDQALGYHSRLTLFRPPCGAPYTAETDRLLAFQEFMEKQKMYPVMWNVDSRDWALRGRPDLIVDNIVQGTPQDGGVLLLHDTQPQTVEALPRIIHYYQTAHFKFTGVRELLAKKYGVAPEGIEASHSDTPSPSVDTRFSGSGDPKDLSSLAECLTF